MPHTRIGAIMNDTPNTYVARWNRRFARLVTRIGTLCEERRSLRKSNEHLARLVITLDDKVRRQATSLRLAQARNATYKAEIGIGASELEQLRRFRDLMLTDPAILKLVMKRAADGIVTQLDKIDEFLEQDNTEEKKGDS